MTGQQSERGAARKAIVPSTRPLGIEPATGPGRDPARVIGVPGLAFTDDSRPLGGAWLLDRLWQQLGIDTCWPGAG